MKSSVPWLLISSAITFPLSSLANEQAVPSSTPQNTGEQTLSSSDNYDGNSSPSTPFTCKNSSFASGTTYTLTSDVSFTNVSKTQAPASQQSPEAQKNESENTDKQEPSSPSTPAIPPVSDDTKDSTDSTGADPHPSPVSPESSTEDTNGDATSPSGDTGAAEDTQDTEHPKDADSAKVEEKTEADNEVKEDEKEKEALESSIPHAPLSFTASSDVASENGVLSPEPKTAPTSTTSQANGDSTSSCFSNTDGSLTFVGGGHSLTFSNISVTAQGSAINNSAGSALTFSGFKNLSFICATNQDQAQADSAIYVGPKAASSDSEQSVDPKRAQANSHTEGSVNTEALVKYAGISSDAAVIAGESQEDSGKHVATATQDSGEKEEAAASSPDIILKQNVNITFSSNSSKKAGGAICVSGSATIENNTGTCTFSNNNAKEQGGAISVNGNCDITGNKNVVFSGNQAQEIPASSTVAVEETAVEEPVEAKGAGGAIYCLKAPSSIPTMTIQSPKQTLPALEPAALLAETHAKVAQQEEPSPDPCLTISGNTSVTFNNNSSKVTGGAIHAQKVVLSSNGNMTFSNNSSGKGGAIYIAAGGDISITAATGSIIFQGNKVSAADPITLPTKKETAIAAASIEEKKHTEEKTDSSQASGSASADITSAFFTLANKAKVQDESQAEENNKPTCNSIHLGNGAKISQLRAQTGQTIFFYDPITTTAPAAAVNATQPKVSVAKATSRIPASASAVSAPAPAVEKTPLKINAPDTPDPETQKVAAETAQQSAVYNGKIVFSGEKLASEDAQNPLNTISVIHNDVSLEAGTLVLSHGAGLLVDSFTQKEGSLIVMDGGTSIITNVTPASEGLQSRSMLSNPKTPIPGIRAVSQRIASSLINFKERSFSATGAVVPTVEESPDGSITINNLAVNLDSLENGKVITLAAKGGTGSVTLTGNLQFQDSSQNFYDNPLLNKNFTLNFLDISAPGEGKVNTEGFNMIPQGATSSDLGYQGKWEVTEIKNPSGKVSFEIKWVSAGYIPTANRRATLVPNSLWCSAIDMRAFQKLVEVSTEGEDFHKGLWISGISNFFHRDSMKEQEGFRHISSGYVVGVSTQPISDKVIDLAFCQMLGKSKDYHLADARSHVYAASVHTKFEKLVNHYKLSNRKGAILARKPEKSPVIFDAQLSYSLNHNSMKTKHTPNPSSRGKWNNHCVAGELGSYLPILVDHPAIEELFPFVKLHIVFVQQEDFKETKGGTENRNFQSAHFINVSLPLGVKFEKTNKLNTYNIRLAYQPDIYRDAPKSKVFLPSVNTAWSTGATNLSRQAMIIDGSDHHHLTDNLEVFCHGAFELRGSSRNYNVDIGGRYKF